VSRALSWGSPTCRRTVGVTTGVRVSTRQQTQPPPLRWCAGVSSVCTGAREPRGRLGGGRSASRGPRRSRLRRPVLRVPAGTGRRGRRPWPRRGRAPPAAGPSVEHGSSDAHRPHLCGWRPGVSPQREPVARCGTTPGGRHLAHAGGRELPLRGHRTPLVPVGLSGRHFYSRPHRRGVSANEQTTDGGGDGTDQQRLAAGTGAGVLLGMVLGLALDNLALGIAIGLSLGVAIGAGAARG